jgi:hypothetical protein
MTEKKTETKKPEEKPKECAFGDCGYCGHSIIYHAPLFGCAKCSCDEYE